MIIQFYILRIRESRWFVRLTIRDQHYTNVMRDSIHTKRENNNKKKNNIHSIELYFATKHT